MVSRKAIAVLLTAAMVITAFAGCGSKDEEGTAGAAAVYTNGVIYTVDGGDWDTNAAEAVAVDDDGIILFVGAADEAENYIGDNTQVVDLQGNVMLPGFIDGHCHTPGTAITELYEIYLYDSITKEQTLADVAAFVDENPDLEAYWGSGYTVGIGGDPRGPKAEWLDEICDDKPIILQSNDGHNYWMNSIAFEMNGITADTPEPPGGSIPVDSDTGELWGTLTDASELITMEAEYTEEQQMEAFKLFQEQMQGWGYTSVMAIAPHMIDTSLYAKLDEQGEIQMRLNLGGIMRPGEDIEEALADTAALRDANSDSALIEVTTVKYFADGVIEGMTGYLADPYDEAAGLASDYRAEFYWDPEELKTYYTRTLEEGFQVHTHSIGDAATTEVINAVEYAQEQVPDFDARNVITHLQVVSDEDKVRMGELNIVGSTQPFWHFKEPEWYEYVDLIALGEERAEAEYPVRSLIDAGVTVTFSGDHPVSPVNSALWAIEAAVTRNLNNAGYYGVEDIADMDDPAYLLNAGERISVKEAIEAYTVNVAYQLFREDTVGAIAPGKYADFVILGDDLFKINPVDIDGVEILATVFNGEVVYGAVEF